MTYEVAHVLRMALRGTRRQADDAKREERIRSVGPRGGPLLSPRGDEVARRAGVTRLREDIAAAVDAGIALASPDAVVDVILALCNETGRHAQGYG